MHWPNMYGSGFVEPEARYQDDKASKFIQKSWFIEVQDRTNGIREWKMKTKIHQASLFHFQEHLSLSNHTNLRVQIKHLALVIHKNKVFY